MLLLLPLISAAHAGTAYDTLRVRDEVTCESLGTPTPELRAELLSLAGPEAEPAWVSTRAAGCLFDLYGSDADFASLVSPWFSDSTRAGLGLIALAKLDKVPVAAAVTLAQAAIATPDERWQGRFRSRVARSAIPEVAALVGVDASAGGK